MTGTVIDKVVCETCGKEIANGYLSRHAKYCSTDKKSKYNKEKAQAYYQRNREKILEKYKENKDRVREYYKENAERIKERQRKYAEENAERLREKATCEHCNQQVVKYYMKRHMANCHKNPGRQLPVDANKQKDFTF